MKKTIIYVIIALMLGSMFASAIPVRGKNEKSEIHLQSVDRYPSEALLRQSADIMEQRLISIGITTAEVDLNVAQATVNISLKEAEFPQSAAWFLSAKGDLGFYETGDREEVIGLLRAADDLLDLLQKPGSNELPSALLGTFNRSEVSAVMEQLVGLTNQELSDEQIVFAWGAVPFGDQWPLYILKGASTIDASMIDVASVEKNRGGGNSSVLIELDQIGGMEFRELTERCVSKAVAIVLDNVVYSAPMVQEAVTGGKCVISGSFTEPEAAQLAAIISSGELPLNFKLVE